MTTFMVLLVGVGVLLTMTYITLKSDMEKELNTTINIVSSLSKNQISCKYEHENINDDIISLFQNLKYINFALIYDSKGNVISEYNNSDYRISDNKIDRLMNYNYKLLVERNIENENVIVGYIYVNYSYRIINMKIVNYAIISFIFVMALIVLTFYIASKIHRRITSPVNSFRNYIKYLNKNINNSVSYHKGHIREINELMIDFNNLVYFVQNEIKEKNDAMVKTKHNEERYTYMFENIKSGIVVLKPNEKKDNFVISRINNKAAELENIIKCDIIGKEIVDVFPESVNTRLPEILMDVWLNDVSVEVKEHFYKNSYTGASGWRNVFIFKITVTDEIVYIYEDITNEKEMTENLKIAKQKAEESDMLKSAFLANMSHEIRTPMNAIIGFSDLLPEVNNKKILKDYIKIIIENGNDLLHLIDDIIDISKIEAEQMKVSFDVFDVNVYLGEIKLAMNKIKDINGSKNVKLIFKTIDKNIYIKSDVFRFKQVMTNLISNSIKFTKYGYIEVGYDIKGDKIQFYVKDTGIGIEDDRKHHIFERFNKLETNEFLHKGTGLGLTISKSLVELLGGTMWFESKWQEGSIFYFTLPYDKKIKSNKTKVEPKQHSKLKENKNLKVLVVEDVIANYSLIDVILTDEGYEVDWAKDGVEAISMSSNNYDVILMDIKMPNMDGHTATELIKEKYPNTPIFALTAYAMETEKEKIKKSGCDEYLTKPINKELLLDLIKKYTKK